MKFALLAQEPANVNKSVDLESLYQMLLDGGPLMIPIALCSVIALAFMVERWTNLRSSTIGSRRFASDLTTIYSKEGADTAIQLCESSKTPLSRILHASISRRNEPFLEMEKVVEDTGTREVQRLSAGLRPLVVVAMITPLLGLLGTVWGMIGAFTNIAVQDGLGKPEMLAGGISQALITTAAGLAIAIPTQAAYYYFRSRIDRFARLAEDTHQSLLIVSAKASA
ncbi:MAG: MotA/TolQ/ExbB proton channel family protein [Planctomycetes bacterium]|nr:MotA/TolQ/ExbB proton channel family protein [Planctomycetota bacterium]